MGKLTAGTLILWIITPISFMFLSDSYMGRNANWTLILLAWAVTIVLFISGVNDCVRDSQDRDYEMRKLVWEMVVLNSWIPPVGPCIAASLSIQIGLIAYPAWLVWSVAVGWYYSTHYGKRSQHHK